NGLPLYALRGDPRANAVVVGPHESQATTEIHARGSLYVPVERAEVKLRFRSAAVPAEVVPTKGGFRLRFDEPAYGSAPGQAAVLYERDVVVGAGTIGSADSSESTESA